jgi:copper(I)-binding protein
MIRPSLAIAIAIALVSFAPAAEADKPAPTAPTAPTAPATTGLVVSGAWVRLPAPGAKHLAAFMTWQNAGTTDLEVTGASSSLSPRTELHTHLMEGGIMKMRKVERVVVKANSTQALQPGGLHVMLMDVPKHPVVGDTVDITLLTVGGAQVKVKAPVLAAAPTAPGAVGGG